jgi:SAM-dependent methyltransferase
MVHPASTRRQITIVRQQSILAARRALCLLSREDSAMTDAEPDTALPVSVSPLAARERLRDLIHGYVRTQTLFAAVRLRLADHLADGPLSLADLAQRCGVDASILRRLLHGLIAIDVVAESDDTYRLTAIGDGLREDVPGSLASYALLSGDIYYRSWLGLGLGTDEGPTPHVTPFARVFGVPLFDWLSAHPEMGELFYQRMLTRGAAFAPAVAACCDLSSARRIVDVGGGHGVLLAAFLRQWPDTRGILFDLLEAVTGGLAYVRAAGLDERVAAVGDDFFRPGAIPDGDVYLLSQILHDWDDERCAAILRNIRRAIRPEGRLLVIEMLIPERVSGPHAAIDLDLLMMVLTGGRERTASEFRRLLTDAGFTLERVHEEIAPGGVSVLEARATHDPVPL